MNRVTHVKDHYYYSNFHKRFPSSINAGLLQEPVKLTGLVKTRARIGGSQVAFCLVLTLGLEHTRCV